MCIYAFAISPLLYSFVFNHSQCIFAHFILKLIIIDVGGEKEFLSFAVFNEADHFDDPLLQVMLLYLPIIREKVVFSRLAYNEQFDIISKFAYRLDLDIQ